MRDGINRLRHAKNYSGFFSTICTNPAWAGFMAGTGRLSGPDPREMAKFGLYRHLGNQPGQYPGQCDDPCDPRAQRARHGAGGRRRLMNGTMEQVDLPLLVRPGTDGALACAVMHCLFRDGTADRGYLQRYTDAPAELELHLTAPHARMGGANNRVRGCRH